MTSTFLIRATWFRETLRYTLQGVALFPVFVASIRYPHHFIFRPLNWGWVRWIGVTSYGLYLIHGPLLASFQQHWPDIPKPEGVAIGLCSSLALTALLYYWVEKPVAQFRKRLERKPSSSMKPLVPSSSEH
jgi:peptidoglycan/LPS O-acetylase OafA/YrhL